MIVTSRTLDDEAQALLREVAVAVLTGSRRRVAGAIEPLREAAVGA